MILTVGNYEVIILSSNSESKCHYNQLFTASAYPELSKKWDNKNISSQDMNAKYFLIFDAWVRNENLYGICWSLHMFI